MHMENGRGSGHISLTFCSRETAKAKGSRKEKEVLAKETREVREATGTAREEAKVMGTRERVGGVGKSATRRRSAL